jgi:hypothetical protein
MCAGGIVHWVRYVVTKYSETFKLKCLDEWEVAGPALRGDICEAIQVKRE